MNKSGENLVVEAVAGQLFEAYKLVDLEKNKERIKNNYKKEVEKNILKLLKENPEFLGYKNDYGTTIAVKALHYGYFKIVKMYLQKYPQYAKLKDITGNNLYDRIERIQKDSGINLYDIIISGKKANAKSRTKNKEIVKEL